MLNNVFLLQNNVSERLIDRLKCDENGFFRQTDGFLTNLKHYKWKVIFTKNQVCLPQMEE